VFAGRSSNPKTGGSGSGDGGGGGDAHVARIERQQSHARARKLTQALDNRHI